MTGRVCIHYRIIAAVSVEIEAVNGFRVGVVEAVYVEESTDFRVVVTRLQIIETRFSIKIVTSVPEGVTNAYICSISYCFSSCIENLLITPCIVFVLYNNFTRTVKDGDYIALYIRSIDIIRPVVL